MSWRPIRAKFRDTKHHDIMFKMLIIRWAILPKPCYGVLWRCLPVQPLLARVPDQDKTLYYYNEIL